jgi:hypothetical protein
VKQARIAELIGKSGSRISLMVAQGVIPDYPEDYKNITNESEVMEYVEECKKIIAKHNPTRKKYKRVYNYELPDVYKEYERES